MIDLSYNQLHVIKSTNFGSMIRFIELDGCPWRCDCHLRDFVAFQRKTLSAKSSRCYEPLQIRGINWDDLSLEHLETVSAAEHIATIPCHANGITNIALKSQLVANLLKKSGQAYK
uniref:Leucine-rich repeat domain-containing protein n=1 Tax=Elaeophora elaphi TaxID=1147741 RepID=A0A0R3S1Q1_9BILA